MKLRRGGVFGHAAAQKLGIEANGRRRGRVAAPEGSSTRSTAARRRGAARLGARSPRRHAVLRHASAELQRRFPGSRSLVPDGGLWIAWPKTTSGVVTDLTEAHRPGDRARGRSGRQQGCAVDDTWSGLRFVYRFRTVRPAARRRAPATTRRAAHGPRSLGRDVRALRDDLERRRSWRSSSTSTTCERTTSSRTTTSRRVPRCRSSPERGRGPVLDRVRWGLVPFWADDLKIGDKLINARAETIARSRPTGRGSTSGAA